MPHKPLFSQLIILIISLIMISVPGYARKHVTQFNLPTPTDYSRHKLVIEASNHSPEVNQPVVFKATVTPFLPDSKVEYQFLINGAPISEAGMHKVHIFEKTGTYKVSAVAKLGGAHLVNSPPVMIHVIEEWVPPSAKIMPDARTVRAGEEAVFYSVSETDPKSRQRLYWSISSGQRSSGNTFTIDTKNLLPGNYPIQLLLKDDRKRESTSHAYLTVTDNSAPQTLTPEQQREKEMDDIALSAPINLNLRASHSHRLEGMPVIYWIQNSQINADTQLQIDTGDSYVSPWGKRLRYGHSFKHFGIYKAQITAKISDLTTQQSNAVTVYIWPLWLPVLMVIIGLLLAGIPFFNHYHQPKLVPKNISYIHYPDPGHQQIIIESEEEMPALHISKEAGKTTQVLEITSTGKGSQHGKH